MPAEHNGATFTFPIIADGQIAPHGRAGALRTAGNLEFLRLSFGQVFRNEPWLEIDPNFLSDAKRPPSLNVELDLEPTPKLSGKLGVRRFSSLASPLPDHPSPLIL